MQINAENNEHKREKLGRSLVRVYNSIQNRSKALGMPKYQYPNKALLGNIVAET